RSRYRKGTPRASVRPRTRSRRSALRESDRHLPASCNAPCGSAGCASGPPSAETIRVTDLAGFVALAIVVIVTPGPDTALTIRNSLVGGRAVGIATALGVALGQAIWSLATSAGIVALLVAAGPAFAALRTIGAAYLVLLGVQALWSAARPHGERLRDPLRSGVRPPTGLRQGVISNLTNPKMAVFFPSLVPQFVSPEVPSFVALLGLGM